MVSLFQQVFENMNYNASLLNFTCISSLEVNNALLSNTITISIQEMTPANYEHLEFSTPVYNNGIVLVAKNLNKDIHWLIFQPFHYSL